MKGIKTVTLILPALVITLLNGKPGAHAEKIYLKNGKTIQAQILYQRKGTLWLSHLAGSLGVSMDDVEKIENDDGTMSIYDAKPYFDEVVKMIAQKRYPEARDACGVLLESMPENSQLRLLRAILSQKIGDSEKASEDYYFLVTQGRADAEVFNNLGSIYAQKKDFTRAAEMFFKAAAQDPQLKEAQLNLAQALLENKDYARAIEAYSQAIKADPNDTVALYNLGLAYFNNGNPEMAKEKWQRVLSIKPQDNDAKAALQFVKTKTQQSIEPAGKK